MLLPLKQGLLYGPVNSRRYGRSLGINLMPVKYKLCSFNCVYCHYGLTDVCRLDISDKANDLPVFDDVVMAIEERLKTPVELDLITFSGNGEPTLYPEFPRLVEAIRQLRDRYRPMARLALLSNSTGLFRSEVVDSLGRIDLPILKLDAGTEAVFKKVNRPARGIDFAELVESLAALRDIYLQTVIIDGTPSNCGDDEIAAYCRAVARIRPIEIHMYSTDRPVADGRVKLVPPEKLQTIADRVTGETGVRVRAFFARQ